MSNIKKLKAKLKEAEEAAMDAADAVWEAEVAEAAAWDRIRAIEKQIAKLQEKDDE